MKKFKLGKFLTAVCALLAFVMVFSLAACGSDDAGGPKGDSKGLTLNSYATTIDVDAQTVVLVTSTVTEDVVWTSSDDTKVTVEGSGTGKRMGTVKGLAVGEATITATSGENYATCIVTVIAPETITITKDGSAVSSVALSGKGSTAQLAATSSRGDAITWESDKPLIASVSNKGLVTAVATSGTATITAKCAQHSDVVKTVTVTVGSGTDASYTLDNFYVTGAAPADKPDTWIYWNEFNNISNAKYEEGVVSFDANDIQSGANWYNVQLFYVGTADDKDVEGNSLVYGQHYKVTFDLDITMAGTITVNGYVLPVQAGLHNYTIYYDHAGTAFTMIFGVDGEGCDLVDESFSVKLSNIKWEFSTKFQLMAPTFSISNNTLKIEDENIEGVGSYSLNLYKAGVFVMGISVKPGYIDPATLPTGVYTCKLVTFAANAHYIGVGEVTSENATLRGSNDDYTYTLEPSSVDGAVRTPGTWTYYVSSWVTFSGSATFNGVATVSFSNNAGNWTDTQLFYKVPGKNAGETYSAILHINNVPNAGQIQVGNDVQDLVAGDNPINLNITEGSGASVTIVFGIYGGDNAQDIQAATDLQIWLELV